MDTLVKQEKKQTVKEETNIRKVPETGKTKERDTDIGRVDYGKVLIVSPSGYGKTFTAKTADSDVTGFINSELKPLSFKGTFKWHGKPKTWGSFLKNIEDYAANDDIKNIIIDSQSAALENLHSEMKNNFKGYDIYSNYNTQVKKYFDLIKLIKKDVIVLSHDETLMQEGYKQKKAKVHGKEYEGRVEAQFTVVLFGGKRLEDKVPKYFLRTFEEDTSAKAPQGLFEDAYGEALLEIPNDAKLIFNSLESYYS